MGKGRRRKNREIKFFTQNELSALFRAIENDSGKHALRNLALFHVGYACGLRISEMGLIQLRHFNPQTNEIHCQRVKGSLDNTIRLEPERAKIIKKYIKHAEIIDDDEFLFKSNRGTPISKEMIHKLMRKYAGAARRPKIAVDKSHWHTLKHSIAVHLAESGADVKELQNYLGHVDVKNTMIYFKYTTKQEDAFYEKLSQNSQLVM